jgi:transcriptional regulator with XRE-family HTH domain
LCTGRIRLQTVGNDRRRERVAEDQSKRSNPVSTALGRRLGGELLRLREQANMTQPQAAKFLSASTAKVAKMERGWVPMRDPDIRALCDAYGVTDPAIVRSLLDLAATDRNRRKAKGWWQRYPELGQASEYVVLEDAATRVRYWQLALVPGLLQTPDYARALAVADGAWSREDEIERFVQARIARQNRLTDERPLKVHAVIHEGALRQQIGGREVMREQLAHLLRLSDLPNVELMVLPYSAGAHPGVSTSFSMLSFDAPGAMNVVHMETTFSGLWLESRDDSVRHSDLFERIAERALAPDDSLTLIDTVAKEDHA